MCGTFQGHTATPSIMCLVATRLACCVAWGRCCAGEYASVCSDMCSRDVRDVKPKHALCPTLSCCWCICVCAGPVINLLQPAAQALRHKALQQQQQQQQQQYLARPVQQQQQQRQVAVCRSLGQQQLRRWRCLSRYSHRVHRAGVVMVAGAQAEADK
jgi:hypothetical protein